MTSLNTIQLVLDQLDIIWSKDMRLRAWNEEKAMESPLYVRVREEDGEANGVVVYLADGNGIPVENGNLLIISPGEPIFRSTHVLLKYGFPLNKKGQLRIHDLEE